MTQSELSKYLESKGVDELLDLHEPLAKSTTDATDNDNIPDWVDQSLLSKTESYQVSRNYKLPNELNTIINNNGWNIKGAYSTNPKFRMKVDNERNYLLLITVACTYICFYSEPMESRSKFYTLDTSKQLVAGTTPPFVHVFDNSTTAISISAIGLVYLWKDFTTNSTPVEYQIPLVSYNESIGCVEYNNENILLGSSNGELYLLNLKNNSFTTYSLFMQKFHLFGLFTQKRLHSLTNIEKSSLSIGRIVHIQFKDETHFYVLTDRSVQSWLIQADGVVKLLSDTNIVNKVRLNIEVLISDNVSKEDLRIDFLNASVNNNDEMIIIANYSIKELGDYVQFALISLRLYQDKPLKVLYAASIPYSAIPSSLKYTPRLSVLKKMVFVTFDSTVIAISTTKDLIFEEPVDLNEDEVLFTKVEETDSAARAIIFTLASGVIHFDIDKKLIKSIYSSGDHVERDELVFKSKLEQAVFFGARSEPLLQFFLRPEGQLDISKIVLNLSNEISNGSCRFLPSVNQTALYVESRYLFQKKIVSVLKENHLLSVIPNAIRVELMKQTELYYLAQVLYKSSFVRDTVMDYWANIIDSVVVINEDASVSCRSSFEDLLVKHTSRIVLFLQSYAQSIKFRDDDTEETIRILENANILLMRMFRKSKTFEEKYVSLYGSDVKQTTLISSLLYDILYDLYQGNIEYIQKYDLSEMMESDCIEEIKKHVYEAGMLLLQLFKDPTISEKDKLRHEHAEVRKNVIEGLCGIGLYERAIELAELHNDIPAVVASVNTSQLSPETIKEKNLHFIELFKEEYFCSLLTYLNNTQSGTEQKDMLDLCSAYPTYAEKFFEHRELKMAWIYHLKLKNYEKALISIQKLLATDKVDEGKRAELQGWMEVISATIKCRNSG